MTARTPTANPDLRLLRARRRVELRRLIEHRRCLVCFEVGAEHRIAVRPDLSAVIFGEGHAYDPGERRLGLGPQRVRAAA